LAASTYQMRGADRISETEGFGYRCHVHVSHKHSIV
jgi:hypothetical protein